MLCAKTSGGLAWLLLCLVSCHSRPITAPTDSGPITVTIEDLDRAVHARQGEEHALAFDVRLSDTLGNPAAFIPVRLSVASGPGEVAPLTAVSDRRGMVRALFYTEAPLGRSVALVRAVTVDDSATAFIPIIATPAPSSLKLLATSSFLSIDFGRESEVGLLARLLDADGNPLPDTPLQFRVVAGGSIHPPTSVTDSAGLARANLTIYGNSLDEVRVAVCLEADPILPSLSNEEARTLSDLPASYKNQYPILQRLINSKSSPILTDTLRLPVHLSHPIILTFLTSDTVLVRPREGQTLRLKAMLSDDVGRVIPGVPVRFSTDAAKASVTPCVQTDQRGVAACEFQLGKSRDGGVVTAEVVSLGLTSRVNVEVSGGKPDKIEMAFGEEDRTVILKVTDDEGFPCVRVPTRLLLDGVPSSVVLTDMKGKAVHQLPPLTGTVQVSSEVVGENVKSRPIRRTGGSARKDDVGGR